MASNQSKGRLYLWGGVAVIAILVAVVGLSVWYEKRQLEEHWIRENERAKHAAEFEAQLETLLHGVPSEDEPLDWHYGPGPDRAIIKTKPKD